MLPKFVDAPDMPTLNIIFFMFTLDILYSHQSLVFAIQTAKVAAREKKVSRHSTNTGIPHRNLIRSILHRFSYVNAKLVS